MRVSRGTGNPAVITALVLALLLGAIAMMLMWQGNSGAQGEASTAPASGEQAQATGPNTGSGTQPPEAVGVRAVATGLNTPWALAFAPDGRLFFTERPGRVRVIQDGVLQEEPLVTLSADETSEGGVMGLAADPGFPEEPYLYTMHTYRAAEGVRNRVVRLRVEGSSAMEDAVLLDGIPGANNHNGGRVKVGPDGMLYVTTGDAQQSELSQDPESLAGKILRIELDGTVPEDNPFPGSPVYSLGHRNPQGLAWHPDTGMLYATEHGPVGRDEVNLIEPGENYGWPEVEGEEHGEYRAPLAVYNPSIAPSGAAFYDGKTEEWRGSMFFATLRGTHLHRLEVDPDNPERILESERLYEGGYGRLRDVVVGPDGALYVATSNRDGRGRPDQGDDRILRIGSAEGVPAAS